MHQRWPLSLVNQCWMWVLLIMLVKGNVKLLGFVYFFPLYSQSKITWKRYRSVAVSLQLLCPCPSSSEGDVMESRVFRNPFATLSSLTTKIFWCLFKIFLIEHTPEVTAPQTGACFLHRRPHRTNKDIDFVLLNSATS